MVAAMSPNCGYSENMMKLPDTIQFMSQRKLASVISIILMLGAVASLFINGLQLGLDFTGGTLIEVGYEQPADLEKVRNQLAQAGYEKAIVINFGAETDVLVRLQSDDPKLGDKVVDILQQDIDSSVSLRRIEYVGPQIGEELRDDGGLGMLFALAVVMAYVAIRFQFKFSVGAVIALIHDVVIVLGFFSILKLDFDLTVLAAILAVIGYSLNDTIVVSDRIRENFRKMRKGSAVEVVNQSLTQTLGRTLMTSFTTMLVLLALFFVGGELIHGFAMALIVGVLIGTYSSIYVAANVLLTMDIKKEDLLVPEKEGEALEELP